MTTATANPKSVNAIDVWNSNSCLRTTDGPQMSEVIVNVQSTDPDTFWEVADVMKAHNGRVCGGFGGLMAKIVGWHVYVEAPTDQVDDINRDIIERFGVSPPVSSVRKFPPVNRWVANYEVEIGVEEDRCGVLADIFDIFRKYRVNTVSIWAGTPAKISRGGSGSQGHAIIMVQIDNTKVVPALREALNGVVDWARVDAWNSKCQPGNWKADPCSMTRDGER